MALMVCAGRAPLRAVSVNPVGGPVAAEQLPMDVGDFTGRAEEVAGLEALLAATSGDELGGVVVCAIAGKPGVGKSALAVHVAHRVRSHFSDGQLYANLHGDERERLDPASVLPWFLRALGVAPEFIPADLDQQAVMYRSLLVGRRVLIVLDNAKDERQVRSLLPGAGTCAVLITSRSRLSALDGAELLDLQDMNPGDAVELLARVGGRDRIERDRPAAKSIADLCGGLPLALRIAGAILKAKQHWPLAQLVDHLGDERNRLDKLRTGDLDVRASFALSCAGIPESAARAFRFLGLLPAADFSSEIVAALVGVGSPDAADLVERLHDAQLVLATKEGRYKLHDLLRLFAREQLDAHEPQVEQQRSLERALHCYLDGAQRAAAALLQSDDSAPASPGSRIGDARTAALAWFETERSGLVSAVAMASEMDRHDLVKSLAAALKPFFYLRAHWGDERRILDIALRSARRMDDRRGEAWALTGLGDVSQRQGQWEKAVGFHQLSLAILKDIGDRRSESTALTNLGVVYREQGRWEEAALCQHQSLAIRRELRDRIGEAQSVCNLGNVYQRQCRWHEAIACFEQALTLSRELGDRVGESWTLTSLGVVNERLGNWGEALSCHEKSLAIAREIGNRQLESRALENIGVICDRRGDLEEALHCYESSLAVCRQIGDRLVEGRVLSYMGIVFYQQHRLAEALAQHEEGLAVLRLIGDHHGEGIALGDMGDVYRSQGRRDEALACYRESLDILHALGDRYSEGWTLTNLGCAYADEGRWDDAITCHEQGAGMLQEIGDRFREGRALLNLGRAYAAVGRRQQAIGCCQRSLLISDQLGDRRGLAEASADLAVLRASVPAPRSERRSRRRAASRHGESG